tara:strand:- start:1054 stop:1245 length:192 start_codon:yes stop_codon:yes gene_type:complete
MQPIKLSTLRIDSGKPLVEVDTTGGDTIFMTSTDIEVMQKYFSYALPLLKNEEKKLGYTKEAV